MIKNARLPLILSALVALSSCATKPELPAPENAPAERDVQRDSQDRKEGNASSTIRLLFAGDIMAHEENFVPGRFDRIWRHVSDKISAADLAFANIESPVMDAKGWRAYPTFNMHTDYVEAAIKAGFDVFSLANNHTNDQYLKGIQSTRDFFSSREGIWAAGLRKAAGEGPTYQIVEKDVADGGKWRILFVAFTELLNRPDYAEYVDYYQSTAEKRRELKGKLAKIKAESGCDIFVISVHTDEPEYILRVTENHRKFFRELVNECGADIVWANHPHVAKEWEQISADDGRDAFIMYANGNTISGQRRDPQFKAPATNRDYTGEGIFMEVTLEKKDDGEKISVAIKDSSASLVTVMIADDGRYVLRFLDDELLDTLDKAEYLKWRDYLFERKRIMESYIPALKKERP